ncbi:MAG: sigma-70 family RNA polymerase sigma factor [Phascolarctobacterium sp.]|nr:sigma-70 family RNA polymerase sigma factor [Phascolarctobacterium sp.]
MLGENLTRERHLFAPKADLPTLVRQAQNFEQTAIDELYTRFRGMIINRIKKQDVQIAFGEDAENIAWEIFYSVVQKIDVDHVRSIDGLLKAALYNEIAHRLAKQKNPCCSLDAQGEQGLQIPDPHDDFEHVAAASAFEASLAKLSEDGQKLMRLLYVDNISLKEAAQILGRSYKATAKLKYKCFKKLKVRGEGDR